MDIDLLALYFPFRLYLLCMYKCADAVKLSVGTEKYFHIMFFKLALSYFDLIQYVIRRATWPVFVCCTGSIKKIGHIRQQIKKRWNLGHQPGLALQYHIHSRRGISYVMNEIMM